MVDKTKSTLVIVQHTIIAMLTHRPQSLLRVNTFRVLGISKCTSLYFGLNVASTVKINLTHFVEVRYRYCLYCSLYCILVLHIDYKYASASEKG